MKRLFVLLLLFSLTLLLPFLFCQSNFGLAFCKPFTEEPYYYIASGAIHIGLFSVAMFFLWRKNLGQTLGGMGFPGDMKRNIIYTVAGLAFVFIALLILEAVFSAFELSDQEKIVEKVSTLPWYILIFAIIAAPVSEELFFRAFLVPRIGITVSSIAFGLVHFAYGSMVEIVGAIIIGVILAVVFKSSRSITPCLAIHIIYNLISIAVMRLLL